MDLTRTQNYGTIMCAMGIKLHYIDDSEVAQLFDDECEDKRGVAEKLRNHPYFTFLDCDNDGDEEDEGFCNSFWRSAQG